MPRGRPKGSKNRKLPGDPGYVPTTHAAGKMTRKSIEPSVMLELKYKMLQLMYSGEAGTITEAAEKVGIPPAHIYSWASTDPEFKEAIRVARQILADKLETKLANWNNFIPAMFLLKAYRPEYRDNAPLSGVDSKLSEILEELKKAGEKPPKILVSERPAVEAAKNQEIINIEAKEIGLEVKDGTSVNST